MDTLTNLFTSVEQVTIQGAIDAFIRHEVGDKSEQTKSWYRKRLMWLADELGHDRLTIDVMDVDLLCWYARLHERRTMYGGDGTRPAVQGHLSAFTLHGHVRAIKRFFKWLTGLGLFDADPSARLKLPTLPKQGRRGISDGNVRAILAAAQGNSRDFALLMFLESTGVRRGGIEDLRLSDLNLVATDPRIRRRATVREKGEKSREVAMSPRALAALEAWLAERPEIGDDHVFIGASQGQPLHPLKETGISSILVRYKKSLQLSGNCSPHQWRHRWCRRMIQRRMPIAQVSQLAGHADIKTTVAFYGQFDMDELQDSYDAAYEDPLE